MYETICQKQVNQMEKKETKKESAEENLGPDVLKMMESLQNSHCMLFLIIFSTIPHL